jgi:hypothetical protein
VNGSKRKQAKSVSFEVSEFTEGETPALMCILLHCKVFTGFDQWFLPYVEILLQIA